ncbi:MAG: aldehyde dehydrogenase [Candidatus Marinimicrobia bacterium]|nr:aldehyde dehydrogenase [Candidatus Neomarinimicrobiota bacterium]|tara:strand:+ start:3710 stop:5227 length:1518 start_codon:yes stop_codon:yes gene_type:complete
MKEKNNFIDQIDQVPAKTLSCINPISGKTIKNISISTKEEINRKITSACEASKIWKEIPIIERSRLIKKAQKEIVSKKDELIELAISETGKTEFDGIIEILTTLEIMRFNRKMASRALASEVRPLGLIMKNKRGKVHYRPYGVVGAISPWNYPLIQPAILVVPALLAGNGVVLKPSEFSPLTALKMKEIFDEVGIPEDLFQIVIGDGEVGKVLVESSSIKLIAFTGSVKVGRKIAINCAEQLKPVILELGGKDPMIVLKDANLKRAARAAVWSGFHNAGQTCISVERIYVDENVADDFIQLVKDLTNLVSYGKGPNFSDIGSISTKSQFEKITSLLQDAIDKGATIDNHNINNNNDSLFFQPLVITDSDDTMKIMKEEIFGPVIVISRVRNEKEAIKKANSMNFGLNASIFTRNKKKARLLAKNIEAGNIIINDVETNYFCVDVPFGGIKHSGIGRLHGIEGLRSFSQIQSVVEDRFGFNKELWWFPVAGITKKIFRAIIQILYG